MKLKVLVTGASGYIGSLLCPKLREAGYEVLALDLNPKSAEVLQGDAADPEVLKPLLTQADVLIPLAAVVGAPACDRNPKAAIRSNFEAVQLMNRLRSQDQKVLFPMTNNGYRLRAGEIYAAENAHFEADSLYTQTKFQAEQELLDFGNAISFRLASLFGVSPAMRWDLLLHSFVHRAHHDESLELYEASFKRNFVHVLDVADCFIYSIQNFSTMKDEIYNLALEEGNISKEALALEVQKQLPYLEIKIAGEGKDPDARDFFASTKKLRKTGFEATRTLREGIHEVLEACHGAAVL